MHIRLTHEDQVLDETFRKNALQEIIGSENVERKKEFLRRSEVYKDKTVKYVVERLQNEGLAPETVALMKNRAANISVLRKVVNKLARTYTGGVKRDPSGSEDELELARKVGKAMRLLDWDDRMKKSDRYRELHRNNAIMITADGTSMDDRKTLKMRVLNPWSYDVIEDPFDREKGVVWILSDFVERSDGVSAASEHEAGFHRPRAVAATDGHDSVIADAPADAGKGGPQREFIWWTQNYHFTTDSKGRIIREKSPEDGRTNPIGMLPIVNNAESQDGEFWAEGGDDLTDGAILINLIITDMFAVQRQQGWGIPVATGKNLPDSLKVGINNAVLLEHDKDDPTPSLSIVSSNPPLEAWMRTIEQYLALYLTTNNLSTANVSVRMDANTFPSGIALLIEMSEAVNDVEDKQKDYQTIERRLFQILKGWLNAAGENELVETWADIGSLPEDFDISIQFSEIKPVVTEGEKLEILSKRKDLGIDRDVDLIMRDNPDLTEEEATQKLLEIKGEALVKMLVAMARMKGGHSHMTPNGVFLGPEIPGPDGSHWHEGTELSIGGPGHVHKMSDESGRTSKPIEIGSAPPIPAPMDDDKGDEEE